VTITDSKGCVIVDSTKLLCDAVWPGDVNKNGLANHYDLFSIGIYFNDSGPARDSIYQTDIWDGYPADPWDSIQSNNGRNMKHVDCNGNGKIEAGDVLAIKKNFGLSHSKRTIRPYNPANPDLYFEIITDDVAPGSNIEIAIMAGRDSISIYGIGFDVLVDMQFIEPNTMTLSWDSSWLGQENKDMFAIDSAYSTGYIYGAAVRFTHTDQESFGEIARIQFTVRSDTTINSNTPFNIQVTGSKGVISTADSIVFNPSEDTIVINSTRRIEMNHENTSIKIYPNPVNDELHIDISGYEGKLKLEGIDLSGRRVYKSTLTKQANSIDLSDFKAGAYLVQITGKNLDVSRQIILQ